MENISQEEKFIINKLKDNEGSLNYKALQDYCADVFEGVIPGFSADITLIKDPSD